MGNKKERKKNIYKKLKQRVFILKGRNNNKTAEIAENYIYMI